MVCIRISTHSTIKLPTMYEEYFNHSVSKVGHTLDMGTSCDNSVRVNTNQSLGGILQW